MSAGYPTCENDDVERRRRLFYSMEKPKGGFKSVMNLPADTLQISQEEQGRLLARVYAFILSEKFTGTHKEQDDHRTIQSPKTRQAQPTGIIQVIDAQTFVSQEPEE